MSDASVRALFSDLFWRAFQAGRRLAPRDPRLRTAMAKVVGPPLELVHRLVGGPRGEAPPPDVPYRHWAHVESPTAYEAWIAQHDTLTEADRKGVAAALSALDPLPLVSVIGGDPGQQLYPALERVKEFSQARGEWVAFLNEGVALAPQALASLILSARDRPDAAALYADEDIRGAGGGRRDPWFKPDFDIDLMLAGQDLVGGGIALFRRTAVAAAGGPDPAYQSLAAYDLALRLHAAGAPIRHVPEVLAHRAAPPALAPSQKQAAASAWLAHRAPGARIEAVEGRGLRVRWPSPDPAPKVSVVVPTRDRAGLMAMCAEGLLQRTDYPDLEMLIVDNGSEEPETHALFARLAEDRRVRILPAPGPFNYSRLNNDAAAQARGDVLLLLNNDIEVTHPDWLREMVSQALRPDVGAVGAKLYFPDGRMQHAGIVLGVGGVASYYHPFVDGRARGYRDALVTPREVGAVTGACVAMRREVFEEVGGLDADNLAVAFNDVDLSLRIREAGYRVVWTPYAELIHHESATRGSDNAPQHRERFAREIAYMRERWGEVLDADPFYSPNFDLSDGNFHLAAPRRRRAWA